jgi:hypothetical protein
MNLVTNVAGYKKFDGSMDAGHSRRMSCLNLRKLKPAKPDVINRGAML